MTAQQKTFESALAVELFRRTKFSAPVGTVGVAILALSHLQTQPWQTIGSWMAWMVCLQLLRFWSGRNALQALSQGQSPTGLLKRETLLSAIVGIGWGSAVFVFNTQAMDQTFYLRLIILAGAMAFIVASTAVFLRVFLAYTLPIGLGAWLHVLTQPYVTPHIIFLLSISLYVAMLIAQAINLNRGIRAATASHLAVLHLTEELNATLDSERKLREALKIVSLTDELTGIFNRRGATENLATEIARAKRQGLPLSVLMIDVDNFKPINDTHGHSTGDLVLRTVVQTMKNELRSTDVMGRIGGDEFLVVLPTLGADGALATAQRLHHSVSTATVDLQVRGIAVTISLGLASYRPDEEAHQLLARADKALYNAKEKGRNRIETEIAA